ncbi:hypothetical protein WJX82_001020 [Trebouxia sp. C0006]
MPGRPGRFGAGRPTTIEFEPSSFAAQVEYRSNVTASAPHRFYGQHAAGLFTGSNRMVRIAASPLQQSSSHTLKLWELGR